MSQPSYPSLSISGTAVQMCDPSGLALFVTPGVARLLGEPVARGELIVAPGIPFLYEPDAMLVQSVYDDYRREHHGLEALSFVLRHGDAFPRADVVGCRASSGKEIEVFLKQLDLGARLRAFLYYSLAEPSLGQLGAAVWVDAEADGWIRITADDERAPRWLHLAVPCWQAGRANLSTPPDNLFTASLA